MNPRHFSDNRPSRLTRYAMVGVGLVITGTAAHTALAAGTAIYKANNATDLNTATSYVTTSGGTTASTVAPSTTTGSYSGATGSTTANTTALDIVFDSTITTAANSVFRTGGGSGATFAIDGITMLNPAAAVTVNQNAGTTTIGLGGIDMSNATQDLTFSGGTIRVGPGINTAIAETWTVASGRTLTVNNVSAESGTNTLTLAGAGNVVFAGTTANAIPLIVNGAAVTVTGAGSTTGAITLTSGSLRVGNGGTTGTLGTGAAIMDNSTLIFNRSNAVAQGTDFTATAISGSGALTQNGGGMLTLTAANTYTGKTTVNAGILVLSTGSLASATVSVTVGALTLQNATALADTSTLNLATGTTLNLDAGSGTSEFIASLIVNGTTEPSGTYSAGTLNGVTFESLNGETLTVGAVPEPSAFVFGFAWFCVGGGLLLRRDRANNLRA